MRQISVATFLFFAVVLTGGLVRTCTGEREQAARSSDDGRGAREEQRSAVLMDPDARSTETPTRPPDASVAESARTEVVSDDGEPALALLETDRRAPDEGILRVRFFSDCPVPYWFAVEAWAADPSPYLEGAVGWRRAPDILDRTYFDPDNPELDRPPGCVDVLDLEVEPGVPAWITARADFDDDDEWAQAWQDGDDVAEPIPGFDPPLVFVPRTPAAGQVLEVDVTLPKARGSVELGLERLRERWELFEGRLALLDGTARLELDEEGPVCLGPLASGRRRFEVVVHGGEPLELVRSELAIDVEDCGVAFHELTVPDQRALTLRVLAAGLGRDGLGGEVELYRGGDESPHWVLELPWDDAVPNSNLLTVLGDFAGPHRIRFVPDDEEWAPAEVEVVLPAPGLVDLVVRPATDWTTLLVQPRDEDGSKLHGTVSWWLRGEGRSWSGNNRIGHYTYFAPAGIPPDGAAAAVEPVRVEIDYSYLELVPPGTYELALWVVDSGHFGQVEVRVPGGVGDDGWAVEPRLSPPSASARGELTLLAGGEVYGDETVAVAIALPELGGSTRVVLDTFGPGELELDGLPGGVPLVLQFIETTFDREVGTLELELQPGERRDLGEIVLELE